MSIWQTKIWGEMLMSSNQVSKIIEINGIFIEKRKISFGKFGLFIIGLNVNNLKKIDKNLLKNLKELCKKEKCLFIQIETIDYSGIKNEKIKGFTNGYYKKFITPYTAVIDLSKDEEKILSEMKPKGRYNIKLAGKKGIIVKEVEKNHKNIKLFFDLMTETTGRNGFIGNKIEYYIKFLEKIENSKLLLAYFEDKVIAGGIFVFNFDISIYYYGASTSNKKFRNLMAPFLLQWEAIKIAKKTNSRIYDFLGVASKNEKNSKLKGVTDFKMKLTKDIINVSSSYIFVNNKIIYFIIKLLRSIKGL